ncbi:hypothetical protein L6452_03878 [Arctium lappa]|uniref:Uncharacterized protein n=1 Tax=Arctium lappa TaxID=4217 RepID=A0ACB9FNY3_ARCLA|nr:hypothetical protein L6452_03878 [Arctium lappa]
MSVTCRRDQWCTAGGGVSVTCRSDVGVVCRLQEVRQKEAEEIEGGSGGECIGKWGSVTVEAKERMGRSLTRSQKRRRADERRKTISSSRLKKDEQTRLKERKRQMN